MFHYRLVNVHQGKALHQVAAQCSPTNLNVIEQANFVAEGEDNEDNGDDDEVWL